MLTCSCGRWMHTQSVDEMPEGTDGTAWLVRSECRECGRIIGCEAPSEEAESLVDRLMWSDDARYTLERMPPHVSPLVRHEVEDYATSKGRRVVTQALIGEARRGGAVGWEPEAEQRLQNIPAAVRTMARIELERTAVERGLPAVTAALMEEVKAKYFGMAAQK